VKKWLRSSRKQRSEIEKEIKDIKKEIRKYGGSSQYSGSVIKEDMG